MLVEFPGQIPLVLLQFSTNEGCAQNWVFLVCNIQCSQSSFSMHTYTHGITSPWLHYAWQLRTGLLPNLPCKFSKGCKSSSVRPEWLRTSPWQAVFPLKVSSETQECRLCGTLPTMSNLSSPTQTEVSRARCPYTQGWRNGKAEGNRSRLVRNSQYH